MVYTVREFRKSMSKVLDEACTQPVDIRRGEEMFILRNRERVLKTTLRAREIFDDIVFKHGCGCVKEDGRNLCKKHGRV